MVWQRCSGIRRSYLGIACLPDFMVREAIAAGKLVPVLENHVKHEGTFRMLWPSSKYQAQKIRVFIDFMAQNLFSND